MNTFITHLFTGKDNKTFDIARVLWAISILVFLGLCIASLVHGNPWQPYESAQGLGWMLFGGGAGVGIKSHTEPTP